MVGIWQGDFEGILLAIFKRAGAWNEYYGAVFLRTTLLHGRYVGERECKVKVPFTRVDLPDLVAVAIKGNRPDNRNF